MSYTDLLKLKPSKNVPPPMERQPKEVNISLSERSFPPIEQKKSEAASKPASPLDSSLASYHDSMIARLRKVVKVVGKDAFFGRFTTEEKGQLAEVAFSYKRRGIKTSENEISRIAINYIVADYQEKGEKSLLERVLKALNE